MGEFRQLLKRVVLGCSLVFAAGACGESTGPESDGGVPCPDGAAGCKCKGGGQCDGDLACVQDICVPPGCEPGTLGCQCQGGVCLGNLVCDGTLCQEPGTSTGGDEDGDGDGDTATSTAETGGDTSATGGTTGSETSVTPEPSLAEAIVAGSDHSCAIVKDAGAVRCWGSGANGRLGYGNAESVGDDETPLDVGDMNIGGKVIQITARDSHSCALLDGGAVRCWGYGADGRLGYGNTETVGDNEAPVSVGDVDVGGPVIQIAAGGDHTCALVEGGTVRCWGAGSSGRLGYGNTLTIGDDEPPSAAGDVPVGGEVVQVTAGAVHTCALLEGGAVRCWGAGSGGRLGYGDTTNIGDTEPAGEAGDVPLGGDVAQISAGAAHTCALMVGGAVRCWGSGADGQLGYGNTDPIGDDETPDSVGEVDVGGTATLLSAGRAHTCAVLTGGTLRCWGNGSDGRLGYSNVANVGDVETPASAGDVNVGGELTQIVAGGSHTCAVLVGGGPRCWGLGANGRLGYGNTASIGDDEAPASAGDIPL